MTATYLHPMGALRKPVPLAVTFSAQLLLLEKSSARSHPLFSVASVPTLTVRAAKVAAILKSMQGYHHYGIND